MGTLGKRLGFLGENGAAERNVLAAGASRPCCVANAKCGLRLRLGLIKLFVIKNMLITCFCPSSGASALWPAASKTLPDVAFCEPLTVQHRESVLQKKPLRGAVFVNGAADRN